MKLTPLDIHHKEFSHALRGYNEVEVDQFLDQVADELERLFKENITLSERIEALEERVRGYQDMERTLHNTLVSAQKSADEIIQKAQQEADAVLKDAELKAKDIIHNALTSKQKAVGELTRIKQAEEAFRVEFRRVLETYLRGIGEIAVPADITLMVGQAGDETLADAEVAATPPVFTPPAASAPATMEPAPQPAAAPAPAIADDAEPPASGFVASLHLGDIGEPPIGPDETVSFDVAEFGFGEREDDVDIEEID